MILADIVFIAIALMTLISALMAVCLKNIFYNALSLILCLFGVSAIFIFLNAEFLAIIEIIVYIGAISIAIIFAIMLSQSIKKMPERRSRRKILRSGTLAVLLFAVLAKTLLGAAWPLGTQEGDYSLHHLGRTLLTTQALPFEVISLILLIAIIGALVISGSKENTE